MATTASERLYRSATTASARRVASGSNIVGFQFGLSWPVVWAFDCPPGAACNSSTKDTPVASPQATTSSKIDKPLPTWYPSTPACHSSDPGAVAGFRIHHGKGTRTDV